MGLRRNQERKINFPRTKWKLKHNKTIPLGYIKSSPSWKFIVPSAHFNTSGRTGVNDLMMQVMNLEKQE